MTLCLRSYVCGQIRLTHRSPHLIYPFIRSRDGHDNQRSNCQCRSLSRSCSHRQRLSSDLSIYQERRRAIYSSSHSLVYSTALIPSVHCFAVIPKRNLHISSSWFVDKKQNPKGHEEKLPEAGSLKEVERMIEKEAQLAKKKKMPLWDRVKHEVKHYYHGFRLLILDIRVAIRLAWNVAKGLQLSRRERKQLVRTVSDIFRLVPFLVFVIVPFMEFFLPLYLKMFPFMLPSTFKEEQVEKKKVLQQLKGKLEMAKFLQDTLMETSVVGKVKNQTEAKEFSEFLRKVRETGRIPKEEDIVDYCSLFADDITLDTLTYEQLKALCKLLEIPAIGPSTVLRLQLEMRVRGLKADDYAIAREGGVEKMAVWELITACRERGMRALGLSEERLRLQLQQWLHLHIDRHIPITLLLFTRAMYLPEKLRPGEQLAEFIVRMPQEMIDQTELSVAERASERIDPRKKYDVIKQEQQAIARERQEKTVDAKEKVPEKAKEKMPEKVKEKVPEKAEKLPEEEVVVPEKPKPVPEAVPVEAVAPPSVEEEKIDTAPVLVGTSEEEAVDTASVLVDKAPAVAEEPAPDVEKEGLSVEDLKELETMIIADQTTALDEEELDDLREDIEVYETDVRRMEAMAVVGADNVETKSAKRLITQVNKLMNDMNSMVGTLYKEKESLLEDIEVTEVRMRRASEEAIREMTQTIASKKERVVSINDLMLAIRRLHRISDETRWQKILEVLDEDEDGHIELHHVIKVLDMIGTDNVKLTKEQMARVLDTIDKEALHERLELQHKREKDGNEAAEVTTEPEPESERQERS